MLLVHTAGRWGGGTVGSSCHISFIRFNFLTWEANPDKETIWNIRLSLQTFNSWRFLSDPCACAVRMQLQKVCIDKNSAGYLQRAAVTHPQPDHTVMLCITTSHSSVTPQRVKVTCMPDYHSTLQHGDLHISIWALGWWSFLCVSITYNSCLTIFQWLYFSM